MTLLNVIFFQRSPKKSIKYKKSHQVGILVKKSGTYLFKEEKNQNFLETSASLVEKEGHSLIKCPNKERKEKPPSITHHFI